uniref:Methyltransferase tdiE n=1 Tax=Fusarium oxysporum (strain Fo5176) TaxID=660025 RepID=A0A0D2XYN2_FUSOF
MAGSFEDYDAFISKAYKALEPEGWFEMQDIVLPYKSDDGTLHADLELAKLGHYFCEASKILGRSVEAPRHYKSMMQKAGFINIVERHFKWPLNEWAKDPYYKEIGAWSFANLDGGLEGLTLALFTRGMKWTKEETMTFCAEVRKHLRDPRIHAYLPVIEFTT